MAATDGQGKQLGGRPRSRGPEPTDADPSPRVPTKPHRRGAPVITEPEPQAVLPTPDAAVAVFGDSLHAAERYVALLATEGIRRGLIGPREASRLWDRHLLNCAALLTLVPERADVLDLGSGAGLPGIVLAIQRPTMRVTLLEPLLRRTAFLEECVRELGLHSVSVVRGRAETVAGRVAADVVVARAVAPLERLVRIALPLVRPGGRLVAMKGEGAERELGEARPTLRRLGTEGAEATVATLGHPAATASVVVVTKAE